MSAEHAGRTRSKRWLSIAGAVALAAVGGLSAAACGDGPTSAPLIPDKPNQNAGGGGEGGEAGMGGIGGAGGEGGMGGIDMPDPATEWSQHGNNASLLADIHVEAPDMIYAVAEDALEVGDVIAMWNGMSWESITDGAGGLKAAFHYIVPEPIDPPPDPPLPAQFAAVVGQHIEMWDGLTWNTITVNAPGIHAGLHYIDADVIYAPVGQQIQMWDGLIGEWVPMTDDVEAPNQLTGAFHWVTDTEIYALVQNGAQGEILLWDGAWKPHAAAVDGLRPEMHVVSPTEIYAVIGTQLCLWNGTAWAPFTDELPGLQPAFAFLGPDDIYSVGADQLWHWAPPMASP